MGFYSCIFLFGFVICAPATNCCRKRGHWVIKGFPSSPLKCDVFSFVPHGTSKRSSRGPPLVCRSSWCLKKKKRHTQGVLDILCFVANILLCGAARAKRYVWFGQCATTAGDDASCWSSSAKSGDNTPNAISRIPSAGGHLETAGSFATGVPFRKALM
jgi:hypothetical protein